MIETFLHHFFLKNICFSSKHEYLIKVAVTVTVNLLLGIVFTGYYSMKKKRAFFKFTQVFLESDSEITFQMVSHTLYTLIELSLGHFKQIYDILLSTEVVLALGRVLLTPHLCIVSDPFLGMHRAAVPWSSQLDQPLLPAVAWPLSSPQSCILRTSHQKGLLQCSTELPALEAAAA